MSKSGDKTRQDVLLAANRIVLEQDVEHLTLEATAREAGISKGGLLYHFPSKEALIVGMIHEYLERFTQDLQAAADTSGEGTQGRWTRAYLEVTFADNQRMPRMNAGLLAALATNPALLSPVQERFANWVALLHEDGIDPVSATIVRLVADGLWLVELFGLAPPDNVMKNKLILELGSMIDTNHKGGHRPGGSGTDIYDSILDHPER